MLTGNPVSSQRNASSKQSLKSPQEDVVRLQLMLLGGCSVIVAVDDKLVESVTVNAISTSPSVLIPSVYDSYPYVKLFRVWTQENSAI